MVASPYRLNGVAMPASLSPSSSSGSVGPAKMRTNHTYQFCEMALATEKRANNIVPDAWAVVVGFLDGRTALLGVQRVSRSARDGVARAGGRGIADAAKISAADLLAGRSPYKAKQLGQRVRRAAALVDPGSVPVWLNFVPHEDAIVLAAVAGRADWIDALPRYSPSWLDAHRHKRSALVWAAEFGNVDVIDRLALPPFSFGGAEWPYGARHFRDAEQRAVRDALHSAAARGHVAVLDRLARPPFACANETLELHKALCNAVSNGHVAVLDRLAEPPYSLGHADARSPTLDGALCPIWIAVSQGHIPVLDRLALPPYSLEHDDAATSRYVGIDLISMAVVKHSVATLDRLARPPYSLGQSDVRACRPLPIGRVAVLDRLALPPYSIGGPTDAEGVLSNAVVVAARDGSVALLDRLAAPPFSFGQQEATRHDHAALYCAAKRGHVAVLDRLALPPYSLGHEHAKHLVSTQGRTTGLDLLARPPYCLTE